MRRYLRPSLKIALKALLVSVILWTGTIAYALVFHPDMYGARLIDYCMYEYLGAVAMGLWCQADKELSQ